MSRLTPRRTSLLFPLVLATLAACQDSTAPQPLSRLKVQFAQGDNNTWTVNSLADPGVGGCDDTECTLREAVAAAASGGSILFASGLQGSVIFATGSGPLLIAKDVTIDGANRITLDAAFKSRVVTIFSESGRITVKLFRLGMTGGSVLGPGGSIWAIRTSLLLDHVTISNNRALSGDGGGVLVTESDVTISSSVIEKNVAELGDNATFGGRGGGVFVDNESNVTLVKTSVDFNDALEGAGIYNQGSLVVIGSTVSNNIAEKNGGGLFNATGGARVTSSTFSRNSAETASAIYSATPQFELRSSTVTRNFSANVTVFAFDANVANSIIAGNFFTTDECDGVVRSLGHNLATANFGCSFGAVGDVLVAVPSQVFTEVLEEELKDNGGPTKTHALMARGRAVDAGYCPGEPTDQRGFLRPVDDPVMPNAIDACDIGAYERQGPVAAVADLAISQTVDKPSAKQGDKVTYTIRVQNLGPQTAPNVEVNDLLSSGVTFVEARANKGSLKAPPRGENGTVTWTLGDMLSGANETATITVTVIIKGKTTITNVASVTGAVADPNAANNSTSIAVSVGSGGTTKKGGPTG